MSMKTLSRVERLLDELCKRSDREIPKSDVEHILRVTRAQIEMVEQGLED
jgi:hypothetical protein